MNLSYWEIKSWLTHIDYTVVGSGIVGLSCALQLKEKFPKSNVLVLERGMLPQGASTKNAGFACFGSLSEIIEDLKNHSEKEVFDLIQRRISGLKTLRKVLGDRSVDYQNNGGYELFTASDTELYEACLKQMTTINKWLFPLFNANVFRLRENSFNFKNIKPKYSFNAFEGQIDTGLMMEALMNKAQNKGIKILNNVEVKGYSEGLDYVKLRTNSFEMTTKKLFIATNGLSKSLLNVSVQPARAQVLITKPIKNLHVKGTFHLDRGYYYFRNIDDRILLGGGRNLDFKTEETTTFGQTQVVQEKLEDLLKTIILPETPYEIDHRWSGIMGVGSQKKAIVKPIGNNIFCGVRLGGMGIAIGSAIGKELASLV